MKLIIRLKFCIFLLFWTWKQELLLVLQPMNVQCDFVIHQMWGLKRMLIKEESLACHFNLTFDSMNKQECCCYIHGIQYRQVYFLVFQNHFYIIYTTTYVMSLSNVPNHKISLKLAILYSIYHFVKKYMSKLK